MASKPNTCLGSVHDEVGDVSKEEPAKHQEASIISRPCQASSIRVYVQSLLASCAARGGINAVISCAASLDFSRVSQELRMAFRRLPMTDVVVFCTSVIDNVK